MLNKAKLQQRSHYVKLAQATKQNCRSNNNLIKRQKPISKHLNILDYQQDILAG